MTIQTHSKRYAVRRQCTTRQELRHTSPGITVWAIQVLLLVVAAVVTCCSYKDRSVVEAFHSSSSYLFLFHTRTRSYGITTKSTKYRVCHEKRSLLYSSNQKTTTTISTTSSTTTITAAASLVSTVGIVTREPSDRTMPFLSSPEHVLFHDFVCLLQRIQDEIIIQLENIEKEQYYINNRNSINNSQKGKVPPFFSSDAWGMFEKKEYSSTINNEQQQQSSTINTITRNTSSNCSSSSGGITRVLQHGHVIDKGACSFTLINNGIVTTERAHAFNARQHVQQIANVPQNDSTIQEKNEIYIHAGDSYSAAALSIVLHSTSPHVPTFRSDVRIFLVETSSSSSSSHSSSSSSVTTEEINNKSKKSTKTVAFFGGGADLTPSYLYEEDICHFHQMYKDLCDVHENSSKSQQQHQHFDYSYTTLKKSCDDYFYLPARGEHRGTGGIFFEDMPVHKNSMDFCRKVTQAWMPSWLPIVFKRQDMKTSARQKQWQLLRRGRYLEFNLLYDRGVKFGLTAQSNPRVEGIMVSAPPLMAFDYMHTIEPGSAEEIMLHVLQHPRSDWAK